MAMSRTPPASASAWSASRLRSSPAMASILPPGRRTSARCWDTRTDMTAVFAGLDPETYRPHALHDAERMWPETNCYVDLWIEVLHAFGTAPEAMLGFSLVQDFEGDQFTFFKVPLEDLEALYGIRGTELAIFDRVESHVATQIA